MRLFTLLFLLFNVLFTSNSALAQRPKRLTTLPNQLTEVSGMCIAAPDSIWWLNDGGNAPALYLTDARGHLRRTLALPQLANRDWEELTADSSGHLYIGDFGNNDNYRRDLTIYKLRLSDLRLDSIRFTFPEQTAFPPRTPDEKDFDLEAMVWTGGKIHLFTKMHWAASEFQAGHYSIPDAPGTYVAQRLGTIKLPRQVITGAALSSDRSRLALTSYLYKKRGKIYLGKSYLWVFDWNNLLTNQPALLQKRRLRGWITARQVESVGFFDAKTIMVASERTPVQRQKMKRVRLR